MVNLQLIDTVEGGHFVFKQNDYLLDKGVYSELYCALFTTRTAEWLGDSAFDVESLSVSSKTENSIRNNSTFTDANIALIRKSIESDLERFTNKNKEIKISGLGVSAENRNRLNIEIAIDGFSDTYKFIYDKTATSLDNLENISSCEITIKVPLLAISDTEVLSGGDGVYISYN